MQNILPQPIAAPLTKAAIFLTVVINNKQGNLDIIKDFLADLSSIKRAVGFRDLTGQLSCVAGFGSEAWDKLFGTPRPKELHPFQEINGVYHAVSTPGDMLFHIRAVRMDLCFEMATQIMSRLDSAVTVVDEVHGFKYFDDRDIIGFVDGTENPVGSKAVEAVMVGEEDQAFAGGSYVIVQKYIHDMQAWNKLPVEVQEKIIGRKKLSDIELSDDEKPSYAHNALTTIIKNGKQVDIVRDNMPFGEVGKGEFGTYFIGYSRSPSTTEEMLKNMFIGNPPGNHDKLLDYSKAVTGALFFIPNADFLDDVSSGS